MRRFGCRADVLYFASWQFKTLEQFLEMGGRDPGLLHQRLLPVIADEYALAGQDLEIVQLPERTGVNGVNQDEIDENT